jgi:hypothetical protein
MKYGHRIIPFACVAGIVLAGCHVPATVRYESETRTITIPLTQPSETGGGETHQDITFPPDDSGPVSISYTSTAKGTVVAESKSQKDGATLFYALAGLAGIAMVLLMALHHFKLSMLAGFATVGFVSLGVTIGMYPKLYANLAAGGIAVFVLYFGFCLWQDYKDDGFINGSK